MDETQQELILKLTKWLNTQEGVWNANNINVTHISFEVTDASQVFSIFKDDDGSFYVMPL